MQKLSQAEAFRLCRNTCLEAKKALWDARNQAYGANKEGRGINCLELWDMADIASLLTTLSRRLEDKEREALAKEGQGGP